MMMGIAVLVLVTLGVGTATADCPALSQCTLDALILARGGSKGIPLKNLAEVSPNRTLLGRTIDILQRSQLFRTIWVSTDHEQIVREAQRYGASVHNRQPEFARDETTSLESTQEFLAGHPEFDRFALVQCTSPLLRIRYLQAATAELFDSGRECAFSAVRSHKLRWRKDDETGTLTAINFDPGRRPRRQDWPGELVETGMFYFTSAHLVMNEKRFQGANCAAVEVDQWDSLEIDTPRQLELARVMIGME